MAIFTQLHEVGEVLAEMVRDTLDDLQEPGTNVQVGPLLTSATGIGKEIRVTLLWITPQATHRNDDWEQQADGSSRPPPISISAHYLISTYGSSEQEDPIDAHNLLGRVIQTFHTDPHPSLPRGAGEPGSGPLEINLVPSSAELLEKVYSSLRLEHRSWVIYEVCPIQLAMLEPDAAPAPVVRPGGVVLAPLSPQSRPELVRVTPQRQAAGGRIRVDLQLWGRDLHGVSVDGESTPAGAMTELIAGQRYVVTIPAGISEGRRDLLAQVGDDGDPPELWSERETILVLPDTAPSLDAMTSLTSSLAADLTLDGRALTNADEVVFWPADGIRSPADIKVASPSSATDTSVTVTAATLAIEGLAPGSWNVCVRVDSHVYTPSILVDFA